MTELRQDLYEAVSQLDEHYVELKTAARERLGSRSTRATTRIPARPVPVTRDFPNIEPPAYLQSSSIPRCTTKSANAWPHGSMKPSNWRSRRLSPS